MKLKVVRYKNYGLKDSNAGEIIELKFYYSFYELNNGNIIKLQFVQYVGPMAKEEDDYGFFYTNVSLKNAGKYFETGSLNLKESVLITDG